MIDQINTLLNQDWTPEEKELIKRLSDNLIYYKYLIPKNLKTDVISILDMANNVKQEYTFYKKVCKKTFYKKVCKNSHNDFENDIQNDFENDIKIKCKRRNSI